MDQIHFFKELLDRAEKDPGFLECRREVRKALPGFAAVRDALTEEQKALLDNYLASVEALETALTQIAYELGTEHGKSP